MANKEAQRFVNALRILHSIDRDELAKAGLDIGNYRWSNFRGDPVTYLFQADDAAIDTIWRVIEARQPAEQPA